MNDLIRRFEDLSELEQEAHMQNKKSLKRLGLVALSLIIPTATSFYLNSNGFNEASQYVLYGGLVVTLAQFPFIIRPVIASKRASDRYFRAVMEDKQESEPHQGRAGS